MIRLSSRISGIFFNFPAIWFTQSHESGIKVSPVLEQPDTQMRFFGKPEVHGHRRMAVLLARGLDVADARRKTGVMMEQLEIKL